MAEEVAVSTPTADVFVRENLFPDAISSSQDRLALAARTEDGFVAWGNTNTQVCVCVCLYVFVSGCLCACVCKTERDHFSSGVRTPDGAGGILRAAKGTRRGSSHSTTNDLHATKTKKTTRRCPLCRASCSPPLTDGCRRTLSFPPCPLFPLPWPARASGRND